MAGNPPDSGPGFSPHVLDQLQHAVHQVSNPQQGRGRGRGRGGRGQGRGRSVPPQAFPPQHPGPAFQQPPPAIDAFPPLGPTLPPAPMPAAALSQTTQPPTHQPQPATYQSQPRQHPYQRQVDPREFFDRARGDHRPRHAGNRQYQPNFPGHQAHMPSHDGFRRPPAPHGNLYQHNAAPTVNNWSGFLSSDHDLRRQVMAQSDYLNELQVQARAKYQLKQEESQLKETFRKRLEAFFQETLTSKYPEIGASEIRLKCYGSLNNGFGLTECDMDLLLALPKDFTLKGKSPTPSETKDQDATQAPLPPQDEAKTTSIRSERTEETFELGWLLEDALLDARIGARLLTNTRVPIMKVCEKPDDDLLQKMRQYSKESRKPPSPKLSARETSLANYPPVLDLKAMEIALSDLEDSDSAAQVSIPDHPDKVNAASIEFSGDHGIKCDINFSNFVALVNTRLLREYCAYDHRVSEVGVFVKTWAKLRDVNTPYWGTLSSYGYVLMVLHYLMNVVSPPVIPNLQYLARDEDAWKDQASIELFEGKYDIRFWMDKEKIASFKSTASRNRESTGHLIRGFFWYYSAREGFNYKFDAISIRTKGGIIKKQEKGWTEAKWASDNKSVRQRYLLAIEDPFEVEHNVARVVGHNGIVAIRDEFRRAWDIISKIGTANAALEDLLEQVENRGDTLRKDQEHHRQKMRQMKEAAEAKEREMRKVVLQANGEAPDNGTFDEDDIPNPPAHSMRSDRRRTSSQLLTRDVGTFQDRPQQSKHGRPRAVKADSEDDSDAGHEADDERASRRPEKGSETQLTRDFDGTWDEQSFAGHDDTEKDPGPFCDPSEIINASGYDALGNPVAWDLETQSGRWLHWRDSKIRQGQWRGVRGMLAELHQRLPYDPERPRPKILETFDIPQPPFPLDSADAKTSKNTQFGQKRWYNKVSRRLDTDTYDQARPGGPTAKHRQGSRKLAAEEQSEDEMGVFPEGYSAPQLSKMPPSNEIRGSHSRKSSTMSEHPPVPAVEIGASWADQSEIQQVGAQPPDTNNHYGAEPPGKDDERRQPSISNPEAAAVASFVTPIPSRQPNPCPTRHISDRQRSSHPNEAVGLPIPWDVTTRGGRWLIKRDRWTRLGIFREPRRDSVHIQLNKCFPYDATMTWRRLAQLNEELRILEEEMNRPANELDPHERHEDNDTDNESFVTNPFTNLSDSSTLPVTSTALSSRTNLPKPYSLLSSRSDLASKSALNVVSDTTDPPYQELVEEMADSAFIRSRRLAFFAQQERESSQSREIETAQCGDNVQNLMKAAGIDVGSPPHAHKDPAISNLFGSSADNNTLRSDEKYREQWPYGKRPWTKRSRPRQMPQTDGPMSLTESSENQISEPSQIQPRRTEFTIATEVDVKGDSTLSSRSHEPDEAHVPASSLGPHQSMTQSPSGLQVPDTLYPHLENDKRPRDEDPNIMPIPRTYGFEFDIRQLQDLAIIKEGGNGCARDGFQFEVEQDYELGGSGEMALKQSSGKRFSSNADYDHVYEYGEGDKEGLLGELPDL